MVKIVMILAVSANAKILILKLITTNKDNYLIQ